MSALCTVLHTVGCKFSVSIPLEEKNSGYFVFFFADNQLTECVSVGFCRQYEFD